MIWLFVTITFLGAVLVAAGKPVLVLVGHIIWLFSNGYFAGRNYLVGDFPQAILFFGYWLVTVFGVWKWWPP